MVGFDPYLSRFLLTPPRGGRPFTILSSMVSGLFLLTPPRGGRQGRYCRVGNRPYFYSRPRVGGDEQMAETQLDNLQDFYSRPRVGGDEHRPGFLLPDMFISTHAPAWGATFVLGTCCRFGLFLLTPPRGGRRSSTIPTIILR